MPTPGITPITVLLVEDDEVDVEALRRSFQRQQVGYPLVPASDGLDALRRLRGEAGYEPLSQPYVILLDLNMPRMNGFEFLQVLRDDPNLRQSIVFVFTTSDRDEDKRAVYDKQVAGYLLKSRMDGNFSSLIHLLQGYQQTIEFPPKD